MKIKAVINLGSIDYPNEDHQLLDGQEADINENVAKKMIARGHAVAVPENTKSDKQNQKGA